MKTHNMFIAAVARNQNTDPCAMLGLTRHLAVATMAIALFGCAATVTQSSSPAQPTQAMSTSQAAGKKLVLRITGSPAIQANSDWSDFLEEWQKSMADAAADAKMIFIFAKRDEDIPVEAGKLVRLKVNDFRYVTQVKRYMLGLMAGNATMDIDAEYIDLSDKKVLGSNKFNSSTSAGEGIFSAASPKQVQAVSGLILKDLLGSGTVAK